MFRSSTDASENYKSTRTLCHSVRQPPSSVWPATVASSFPAVPAPCTRPMRPSTIRMCSSWAFPCWAFATVCRWLTRNSVAPFRRWRCARMDSTILRWSHCVRCSSKWAIVVFSIGCGSIKKEDSHWISGVLWYKLPYITQVSGQWTICFDLEIQSTSYTLPDTFI